MTWATIATWRMSYEGVQIASKMLQEGKSSGDAVEKLINQVESYPYYKSVGYGGLPNEEGVVEMDAAFMDGDTLAQGAVGGIQNVKYAVSVARSLSYQHYNSFRIGEGATKYALLHGFEITNMLTDRAKARWQKQLQKQQTRNLNSYNGHDTVGAITLDINNSMAVATSTSGLFMKKSGRIGDSPLSGSGFYVDSEIGGAAATGLGEDIMKGCLSYDIVQKMGTGKSPQQACDQSVYSFVNKLKNRYGKVGEFSLIALNNKGEWGVATNVEFTFSIASGHKKAQILIAHPDHKQATKIEPITQEWLDAYEKRLKAPLQ